MGGIGTATVVVASVVGLGAAMVSAAGSLSPPQEWLSETGLFEPGSVDVVRPGIRTFTPQYPLWSDGATKRRWISIPPGSVIDASRAGAWEFPRGVRFWKEFSVAGRRVETRLIERQADGSWRFAAYVWNDEGSEAKLAPSGGMRALELPGGARYAIPSEADCRACHEGGTAPVLGFTALQLSPDRDPLAPHAEPPQSGDLDLAMLVKEGSVQGLPQELIHTPPRIHAPTPAGRAVLGYLNANCGQCHADPKLAVGAVPVELQLAIDPSDPGSGEQVLRNLLESESRYRPRGASDTRLLVPGDATAGTLLARIRSRDPRIQMPPLGSAKPDLQAIALIEQWIERDLNEPREQKP
jgi:Planctomycete cytochrome C